MKYKILSRTTEKDILNMDEANINKGKYFYIRDKAWRFLIDNNVTELPLNLNQIAKNNKWGMYTFNSIHDNDLLEKSKNCLGLTVVGEDDRIYILFNPELPLDVKRFTIAHEIGHIQLGHFTKHFYSDKPEVTISKAKEKEANMFAARLLMPTIALKHLEVEREEEIMELCQVSKVAAKYRLNRVKKILDERNKYDTNPLEQQIHEMLWDDLESKRKK